jgi:hypothetical protein
MMYPRWWLESIGFWGAPFTATPGRSPMPVRPNGYPTLPSKEAYAAAYPNGLEGTSYTNYCFDEPKSFDYFSLLRYLAVFIVGSLSTLMIQRFFPGEKNHRYEQIPDRV